MARGQQAAQAGQSAHRAGETRRSRSAVHTKRTAQLTTTHRRRRAPAPGPQPANQSAGLRAAPAKHSRALAPTKRDKRKIKK
ncbi:uncharacterized protein K452DRAFT_20875 [Aplosporella prunicola CBS 121167]|uniref:Uncharacterized protein n=1 Tax=Aplosporella prunicola CBS 121167 TaxID=1176127 RepID=A0A6A6BJ40_9PEZI|nr:uncharacterized protein K452DRAFT_20875 [Aplosporella prunicola CBS 121167]KAF2142571.1 hypothetical protein K452DRAFT_20875 [Aplosporella prunicola CBS 121167]